MPKLPLPPAFPAALIAAALITGCFSIATWGAPSPLPLTAARECVSNAIYAYGAVPRVREEYPGTITVGSMWTYHIYAHPQTGETIIEARGKATAGVLPRDQVEATLAKIAAPCLEPPGKEGGPDR